MLGLRQVKWDQHELWMESNFCPMSAGSVDHHQYHFHHIQYQSSCLKNKILHQNQILCFSTGTFNNYITIILDIAFYNYPNKYFEKPKKPRFWYLIKREQYVVVIKSFEISSHEEDVAIANMKLQQNRMIFHLWRSSLPKPHSFAKNE